MPLYLGVLHQSRTCCTCWLNISSSAEGLVDSGSSWKESVGCVWVMGGCTGERVDISVAPYDKGRKSCLGVVVDGLRRHCRRCRIARLADLNMVDVARASGCGNLYLSHIVSYIHSDPLGQPRETVVGENGIFSMCSRRLGESEKQCRRPPTSPPGQDFHAAEMWLGRQPRDELVAATAGSTDGSATTPNVTPQLFLARISQDNCPESVKSGD